MNPDTLCHRCGAPIPDGHTGPSGYRLCTDCESDPKARRKARSARFSKRARRVSLTAYYRGEPGRVTGRQLRALWARQNGRCTYCRCSLADGFDVDHMMPRSRGGSTGAENLQLLCPGCNRSKGAKTHLEYLKEVR